MKKKIIILLAVIALLAAGGYAGYRNWYDSTHVVIESADVPCDTTELTLTDPQLPERETLLRLTSLQRLDVRSVPLTPEQYDQLRLDFPNCEILWLVPFQGEFISPKTGILTVTDLNEEDFGIIPYLPDLHTVDISGCQNYDTITTLQSTCPDLDVRYTVSLMGYDYPHTITELILENADMDQLVSVLPYLPYLERVQFTAQTPDLDQIYQLMCQYPDVHFEFQLSVCGVATSNMVSTLILSDIPMESTAEVEASLKYFPELERVEMCNCGISSEEMDILSQKYPDIRFVWTIKIRAGTLRTDAIAFIPYKLGYDIDNPLYDSDCKELKYCIDLICLDMGHMKIRDLSFLESMPKMKYLIVGDTPVRDFTSIGTLKELIYLEIFNVQFTQHEILLNLTNLQDLNLGATPTKDIDILKQMTWLKRLWIPGTRLNDSQYNELMTALPNTQVVMYAMHSTDKGWRENQNYRDMRDLLGMWYMH